MKAFNQLKISKILKNIILVVFLIIIVEQNIQSYYLDGKLVPSRDIGWNYDFQKGKNFLTQYLKSEYIKYFNKHNNKKQVPNAH